MKICTIIGARPQFIKAASVSRVIKNKDNINEILIHTGQHYDRNMSDIFFKELNIPMPKYNLCIGGGTHGQNTGRMIENIEKILYNESPDWVIVYGDTDSTLAGALAAAKLNIPIAHIEAGLRSHNRSMPEEINRIVTDHISNLLFTPTDSATENIINEGIPINIIHKVGDVMYDSVLFYGDKAESNSNILKKMDLKKKKYILMTVHRKENVENREKLKEIFDGFKESKLPIVFPVHPRTFNCININKLSIPLSITMIDPVGYLDMLMLEKNSAIIATDSGGIQKESYFYKIPCITLREETEWLELVSCGFNKIVGANSERIKKALSEMRMLNFDSIDNFNLYGNGDSSIKIVDLLLTSHA